VQSGDFGKDRRDRRQRHVSANRAIADLLSDVIEAHELRRKAYLELADRFQKSKDPVETKRLRVQLARMTFGVTAPDGRGSEGR
jgi:hypothetical protein